MFNKEQFSLSSVKTEWIKGLTMHYGTLLAQWTNWLLNTRSKGPWLKWGILTVTGFLHILHSNQLKLALTLRTLTTGFVGLWTGANWETNQTANWGLWKRGTFVFNLKHFWDALQTFLNISGVGLWWMFGTSQCGNDCEQKWYVKTKTYIYHQAT